LRLRLDRLDELLPAHAAHVRGHGRDGAAARLRAHTAGDEEDAARFPLPGRLLVLRRAELDPLLLSDLRRAVDAEERVMMREENTRDIDVRPSSVALWFGALGGPVAWLIDLQIRYAAVAYACRHHAGWIMWLVTLAALALAVIAALVGFAHRASEETRVRF